jgi:hypothetical protein
MPVMNAENTAENMPVMNAENTDKSLEVVKLEEAKYASICVSVYANTEQFMHAGIFDLGLFWSQQKSILPVHYSLWMAEVGCAKVASANVEVVFSGAGRGDRGGGWRGGWRGGRREGLV